MDDPWIGIAASCGHCGAVEEVTWVSVMMAATWCHMVHTTDQFVHKYLCNLVAVKLAASCGDAVCRHWSRSQVGVCCGTCLVSGKMCRCAQLHTAVLSFRKCC
jgi:hypothetical protein